MNFDEYPGDWVCETGHCLQIRRVRRHRAEATLLDPSGNPVIRPYAENAPAVQMPARYDDFYGHMEVELWYEGSGFTLSLVEVSYDFACERDSNILTIAPGLSRHTEDEFLGEYSHLFPLKPFHRKRHSRPTKPSD